MNKKLRFIMAITVLSGMSSNSAHAGVISKVEKRAIQSGQMGGIIPSITESGKTCSFGEITFRNLQTGKFHKGKFSNPTGFMSVPRARVLPVPPGYYQPVYAECVWKTSIARQVKHYRGLDRSFQPLLVRGNEVVYYGTLDIQMPYGPQRPLHSIIGQPRLVYDSLLRSDRDLANYFVERPLQRR